MSDLYSHSSGNAAGAQGFTHDESEPGMNYITPDDDLMPGDRDDDQDSLYSSGSEESTTSIDSYVFNYKYENGRRYHAYKDGAYSMPNDEKEQDRLDMTHHLYLLLTGGKLFTAPLPPPTSTAAPQRILDIGTGTGIWAINIAEEYPSAEVIATDLSPIQPKWVPPNLQFEVDDCEDRWTWSKNSFGYIHIRGLLGSVKDWPKFLKQAYDHLVPGGWIEIVEHSYYLLSDDNTYPEDCAIREWFRLFNKAAVKSGRPTNVESIRALVEKEGFVNVDEKRHKLPWGAWAKDKKRKEMGYWVLMITESGFESFGIALMTRVLGMKLEDVQELNKNALAELKSRKFHLYNTHHFITAQKPLE